MLSQVFRKALMFLLTVYPVISGVAHAETDCGTHARTAFQAVAVESIEFPSMALVLRTTAYLPPSKIRGDVIYLHGFGDRFDNHKPLFDSWVCAGLRVISFDLPGHGESSGEGNSLDRFRFDDLAYIVRAVELKFRDEPHRPLFLAGWSLGGLVAIRMLQQDLFAPERRPSGVVLMAPAVAPKILVGEWGIVTRDSLTSNSTPPTAGEIKPQSPFHVPFFAARLQWNAAQSWLENYPAIPTLLLTADADRDAYVRTPDVLLWAENQNEVHGAAITVQEFPGAWHELDNEPGEIGSRVRARAAEFLTGFFN